MIIMVHDMPRYAKVKDKDPREVVLLVGNGCFWKKCGFCNYYNDFTKDPEEQYKVNKEVFDKVTGEFGTLEAINSGSIFELNSQNQDLLFEVCKNKNIKKLIIESHYVYKKKILDFKEKCNMLGINLVVHGGVETFDYNVRENLMKKGMGNPTVSEIREVFDEINLLVGVKGQTLRQVEEDIEIGLKYFDRICVNLYKEMPDIMPGDDLLKKEFIEKLYSKYKDNPKADILINNTDLGVGD